MDFAFSDEQQMLRTSARDWLAGALGDVRVAELADSDRGWDPATWAEITRLGWLDDDLGPLEHAVLMEEAGYALYTGPLWTTVGLCAGLGVASSSTLAWAEEGHSTLLRDAAALSRTTADTEGRLTGTKRWVPDADKVATVVVVAQGPEGPGLYAVDTAAHPDVVVRRSTVDRTRRLSDLVLNGTPSTRLETPIDVLSASRRRALASLACEAVGVAQKALDIAKEHTSTREQFGKVIGTYQGVSHQVADMYVDLELARSLAYWASWAVAAGDPQADQAVAAAKSAAGEAAVLAVERAIQCMGGIGFTWDHVLHRYYKRAQWIDSFDGFGRVQRAEIATALLG